MKDGSLLIITLNVFFVALVFPDQTAAISCFNFSNSDGSFTSYNAPIVQGCSACTKTIAIYKQPENGQLLLSAYVWGCTKQGPISTMVPSGFRDGQRCIGSTMVAYYNDNSMYSANCGCCTDNCNNAVFKCGGSVSSRLSIFGLVVTVMLTLLLK